jgi:hypothetical protein
MQLYLLCVIGVNNKAATENYHIRTASQSQLVFKNWHFVLPEEGTHIPKRDEDAPLTFVLRLCI